MAEVFSQVHACARQGSSLGGSFLKVRGIYVGFCLELHSEGAPIVTTVVQSIARTDSADVQ